MKFINKITFLIVLGLFVISVYFIPDSYKELYSLLGGTLGAFLLYLLIAKFKCIKLIAGVETDNQENADILARYFGNLMLIITIMLLLGTLLSLFKPEITHSWMMIFLAIPILLYIPYCLYKTNK